MFIPSLNVLSKKDKKICAFDVYSLYSSLRAKIVFPIG